MRKPEWNRRVAEEDAEGDKDGYDYNVDQAA